MQILSATIRLDQTGLNQIKKDGLTPAEIHILRHVHGFKSVQDIKVTGEIVRTSAEERRRLTVEYRPEYIAAVFPSAVYPMPDTFVDEGDPDDAAFTEDGNGQLNKPVARHAYGDADAAEGEPAAAGADAVPGPENTFKAPLAVDPNEGRPTNRRGNGDALAKARETKRQNDLNRKAAAAREAAVGNDGGL